MENVNFDRKIMGHLFAICSGFLDIYWLRSNRVDCLIICISSHYPLLGFIWGGGGCLFVNFFLY